MALIGYKFINRDEILPFCEPVAKSASEITSEMLTLKFAHSISVRFNAWVACGFAELAQDGKLFNSQILVNAQLDKIHLSRKVFLYDDDKLWAEPSEISF